MKDLAKARTRLRQFASPKKAAFVSKYFKTGKGEYGEGDVFIGVTVPNMRQVAKQFRHLSLLETEKLLKSKIHEERSMALEILSLNFKNGDDNTRAHIFKLYIRNKKHINNWDLIDGSAPSIVGPYLKDKDKILLLNFAKSKRLWDRRVAMLATFSYIREKDFDIALRIAKILLKDEEDLMHKAVGWMLREIGNRDLPTEESFLKKHYKKMPRTMLRYAIEKFPEPKRLAYLKGNI